MITNKQDINQIFEKVWNELKNTPRGKVIKFTRKYVAKHFFYEGFSEGLDLALKMMSEEK